MHSGSTDSNSDGEEVPAHASNPSNMVAEHGNTEVTKHDAVPGKVEAHDPSEMMGGDTNNHKRQKVSLETVVQF